MADFAYYTIRCDMECINVILLTFFTLRRTRVRTLRNPVAPLLNYKRHISLKRCSSDTSPSVCLTFAELAESLREKHIPRRTYIYI